MTTKPPKLTRSDLEGELKKKIIKYLKSKGCKVRVNKQDATTQTAFPDLTFYCFGRCGFIEVKKHADSPFRPGQERTIADLRREGFYAEVVFLENWSKIKEELDFLMKDWHEGFSKE